MDVGKGSPSQNMQSMQEKGTYGSCMYDAKGQALLQALQHEELPQYLSLLQKAKEDKQKGGTKEDKSENKDKPPQQSPKRTSETSQERQQRYLSKSIRTGHNPPPISQHNSCVQLQMKEDNGNYLSLNNDDSDNDSYKTESEDDDNPNAPENSNDEFENDSIFNNDSELEELMNNLANGSAMELHKMVNFPHLLNLTKISL